jgi:hypothetical protein
LRAYAGYHLKRAYHVFKGDLDCSLKEFDLRMVTYSALALIVDTPGLRRRNWRMHCVSSDQIS